MAANSEKSNEILQYNLVAFLILTQIFPTPIDLTNGSY